jgi:hypothetical protein
LNLQGLRLARIGLLVVFLLGVVALLTFFFQDFVRQVMAVPAARFIWFVKLLIDSTPQVFFWGILVIIFLVVSIQSLSVHKTTQVQAVAEPLQPARRERIAYWTNQVAHVLSGDQYSRARIAAHLGEIALQLLAFQQKEDPEKIRLMILRDQVEIPPEISACVKARFRPVLEPGPGFWASIRLGLQRLFPFLMKNSKQPPLLFSSLAPGDELEEIIHYLEEQLEVSDGIRD